MVAAPPLPTSDPTPPPSIGTAHVLVVDDDEACAGAVESILGRLGHRFTWARGWTEALRAFSEADVGLVLMDAVMPTVDGFKLTKILRSRRRSYVPIVFLTSLADRATRMQCVTVAADDFLTKPVDPVELEVRLKATLRIRALTRDLEAQTRALTRLAAVDALTGVGNRRSLDERLPLEVDRTRREGKSLSVLLLDIDDFKRVNDTWGHGVGDALLATLGRLLGEVTRSCDLPYRYGGEEFVVVATHSTANQAAHLAERIRRAFALRTSETTACGTQTFSIGLCDLEPLPADATAAQLLSMADAALYRAKAGGKNCVCVHASPSLPSAA